MVRELSLGCSTIQPLNNRRHINYSSYFNEVTNLPNDVTLGNGYFDISSFAKTQKNTERNSPENLRLNWEKKMYKLDFYVVRRIC